MNTQDCLNLLVDSESRFEDKLKSLDSYLKIYASIGRALGAGKRNGRSIALQKLFELAECDDVNTLTLLKHSLNEIEEHVLKTEQRQKDAVKAKASRLKAIESGTPVKIQEEFGEQVVIFIEVKRTRFIVENSDGRRFRFPVDAYLGLAEGTIPRVPEDARRKRELVRALVGKYARQAKDKIQDAGSEMVDHLLDEYAATKKRISDAPVGLSEGVFRESLGLVRKVNPQDQALVKRIPQLIIRMSENDKEVMDRIQQYVNKEIREEVLSKASR